MVHVQQKAVLDATGSDKSGENSSSAKCCCFAGQDDDSEYEQDTNFAGKFIISRDEKIIKVLEIVVSALYLISSYFYGYMAGLRYSDFTDDSQWFLSMTLFFELIFLFHMLLQFLIDYRIEGQ